MYIVTPIHSLIDGCGCGKWIIQWTPDGLLTQAISTYSISSGTQQLLVAAVGNGKPCLYSPWTLLWVLWGIWTWYESSSSFSPYIYACLSQGPCTTPTRGGPLKAAMLMKDAGYSCQQNFLH